MKGTILHHSTVCALFIIVLLAFLETYLLLKGYSPELPPDQLATDKNFDIVLGWRNHPSKRAYTTSAKEARSNGKRATITIWPNGSRASFPLARKLTKHRVLLLGGSYTMGEGVEDDQTYAWFLNEEFRNTTFDNFGANGYGTYQCLLLEEILLKKLPKGYYDLVIYAPIEDHIGRNEVFSQWDFEEKFAKEGELGKYWPGATLLKNHLDPMWFFPSAHLKDFKTIEYSPVIRSWPGDRYLAIVNIAKRLYMYHQTCKRLPHRFDCEARELYKRLIDEMYQCALKHNSKFAVLCLDNSTNIWLSPTSPPVYPYSYVTDGHDGAGNNPLFYVGWDLEQHPSPLVHMSWAKHIKEWFDTYKPIPDCN